MHRKILSGASQLHSNTSNSNYIKQILNANAEAQTKTYPKYSTQMRRSKSIKSYPNYATQMRRSKSMRYACRAECKTHVFTCILCVLISTKVRYAISLGGCGGGAHGFDMQHHWVDAAVGVVEALDTCVCEVCAYFPSLFTSFDEGSELG